MGRVVVIGTSLGGLTALERLLGGLSADFPWPVAVVQHRSVEDITGALVETLRRSSALPVREAEDKDPRRGGMVYVGPPDYHLLLDAEGFALSTDPKVCFARPSIDVLFDSAAAVCGSMAVAVVLTGASQDGAAGALRIKAAGGTLVVQDPAGAESRVMPEATLAATTADQVLALDEIAPFLNRFAAIRRVV